VVASSCDPENFCTLPDRVLQYDGSHTTSLHHQCNGNASFPSDPRTAAGDSHDIRDLHDLCNLPVSCVDVPIILVLLRGPLAAGLKKLSLVLRSLNAYVSNCKQISYHFGIIHGDLLHSVDVTDPVREDVDDLDVLDVQDSVPSIVEMFHVVMEALIMFLLGGPHGLSSRWMLIYTMEVLNEHGT
jgi:hypothetical protein